MYLLLQNVSITNIRITKTKDFFVLISSGYHSIKETALSAVFELIKYVSKC